MSKSLYKQPFIGREMLLKCFKKKKEHTFFFERNTLVPFCFVNKRLEIQQGAGFKSYIYRKRQMGLKLGEFAKTRSKAGHKGKRLKISKKRPKVKVVFTYDLKGKFFVK